MITLSLQAAQLSDTSIRLITERRRSPTVGHNLEKLKIAVKAEKYCCNGQFISAGMLRYVFG
jgi:hypothetical protein